MTRSSRRDFLQLIGDVLGKGELFLDITNHFPSKCFPPKFCLTDRVVNHFLPSRNAGNPQFTATIRTRTFVAKQSSH